MLAEQRHATASEVKALLEVRNLRVSYGEVEALHGISFNVRAGEVVVLLGPNGAGKSTAINAIMGLIPSSGGEIEFDGEVITGMPARRLAARGIGLSPEGRKVFNTLSVKENLLVGANLRHDKGEIRRDMELIFESFPRLRERAAQWAGTLSGGEQQMLAIGRALMGKPKLLLLDEPSLGMAPVIIHEVIRIVRELRETGLSILLVEQNAGAALALADRGYVLSLGQINASGTKEELRQEGVLSTAYFGEERV